jgi:prolyl-tRNA editing enzyme YbaK/EbsC (Cys-tRNA(Pro) deacylase)
VLVGVGVDGELPRSVRRVAAALRELGLGSDGIVTLDESTHTAVQAAAVVGCPLGAIVKSLVFRGAESGDVVLVLVAGDNRASEGLVAAEVGEPVERADADFVRSVTGYAIGGIPPVGHASPVRTVIDEDLLRFEAVWAAAGTPRAVFPVAPGALAAAVGVEPARIAAPG